MLPSDDTIKKMMRFRINFFLYGARASGKTFYLKKNLQQQNIPYIYLNCTFADKKVNFFKHLNHELDKFFMGRLKKIQEQQPKTFQSMLNFALANNHNLSQYQQEQDKLRLIYPKRNQIHNVQNWIELIQNLDIELANWLSEIYIFMDNIEQLNVSHNFLTSFYYSCQQEFTNYKIPFIFCGINLPRKIYSVDKPFRNITSFCMPKPINLMKQIIKDTIIQVSVSSKFKDKIKKNSQESQNFSQSLMKQIFAAFEAIESDLNKIKKIAQVITAKVLQMIECDISANGTIYRGLMKMINNGELKQVMRQMTQQGPINDFIVTRRLNQNDQDVSTSQMTIQFYPMLLLTSLHLAEHADQNQDRRRFKDYKVMKKRQMVFNFKNRKHTLQRIIAISESLQTIAKDNDKEKLLKHHSLDYYGCIEHLKQQKRITAHGKQHSLIHGKILGSVKQEEVLAFMKKNNLSYTQFTGVYKDR